MRNARNYVALLFLVGLLVVGVLGTPGERSTAQAPHVFSPRLGVLVVFDQLRADYLERWWPQFGVDGFRRLQDKGAWFRNCNYPYANTVTGAGHATLATGCSPDRHGIIGNQWYDRKSRQMAYCAGAERYGPVPSRPGTEKKYQGGTPERLLAPTLADALKQATGSRGRVVSLSLKDRAAVLPGGKQPDVCYWFNTSSGQWETSTYYALPVQPWMTAYNKSGAARQWFGTSWERLRPDLDYDSLIGPDDVVGEGDGFRQGRTFPHPTGGMWQLKSDYEALLNSPFGNDMLLDLACSAIEQMKLGQGSATDLLCLSFSSNDLIGHAWGPDSQEVFDVTLRSDRLMARLLRFLDDRVGPDNYAMVVSADHGVCSVPEVARRNGEEAGRAPLSLLKRQPEKFLHDHYGDNSPQEWIEKVAEEGIYLNQDTIRQHHLEQAEVEKALAGWLKTQTGIQTALTRTELSGGPSSDPLIQRVQRSFHPDRAADVVVVPKPYWLITDFKTGTNHGTPHPYDTHVPLLVYGPSLRHGWRNEPVTPLLAPVVLAKMLDIPPPAQAQAVVPAGLLRD
jgi:hypothetical protein